MANKVLEKRREIVNVLAADSLLSISEIADFFDVVEHSILMDIKHLHLAKEDFPQKGNKVLLDRLIEKRDAYIEENLQAGKNPKSFLPNIGLYHLPYKERAFCCEEEAALFHGVSVAELANQCDITKTRMRKRLRTLSVEDPEAVIKEGEQYRKIKDIEKMKALILEGVNLEEAAHLTGMAEHVADRARQEMVKDGTIEKSDKPMSYKYESRRAQIYQYYSEGMTKQEIADKMKLTRTTVTTDLKKYMAEHPEAKDKTILWRQRNTQENVRETRRGRKSDVVFLREIGFSPTKISQITKVTDATVRRYLDEEGMLGEYVSPRRQMVDELSKQGLSAYAIAKELGYKYSEIEKDLEALEHFNSRYGIRTQPLSVMKRKAEELKMSWQGATTTEIMSAVGRNRASVLLDQHATSNFLRNNKEAFEYVTKKNGDILADLER